MAIENVTTNLSIPLPHPDNELGGDVGRIRQALVDIDRLLSEKVDAATFDARFAGLLDQAPDALNTLRELADALAGDASFASNVATRIEGVEHAVGVDGALAVKIRQLKARHDFQMGF